MTETTHHFLVQGMDCAGCAQSIAAAVDKLDGVTTCDLNFTTAKLRVNGTAERATIIKTVETLGYTIAANDSTAHPLASEPLPNFWRYLWQRGETKLALLGALFILPGLVFVELLGREWAWVNLLSIIALILAGGPVARSAWRSLTVNWDLNINVLMTIAAIGAVIIGAYTEAGMVMVLFALSEALEGYTGNRARYAIRSLMSTAPNTATRIAMVGEPRLSKPTLVSIDELQVGDQILAKPGERIAMDGRIVAGRSAVDQAAITGESLPVDKVVDDDVFAGSINGEGVLEIVVTHLAADNTISRMIRLVEEA
ncbi:MAG: cation-translocating P-type ATPase, partial [Caldilineaceae bacterium]|nr:cation-translocating P-type ATPase [Caldilineaceae bacterium]